MRQARVPVVLHEAEESADQQTPSDAAQIAWRDYFTDPEFFLFNDPPGTYIVFTTRVVSVRADLLEAEQIFEAAAIDRYAFLRDAYLQRRHNLINDGRAPPAGGPDTRHRKTLKELEEELDAEPPAPAKDR